MHQPLPYEEVTDAAFAAAAAETFTIAEAGGGTHTLFGPCPRCAGDTEIPLVDQVYKSIQRRNTEASTTEPIACICTCSFEHAGRPKTNYGCGAYWNLQRSDRH